MKRSELTERQQIALERVERRQEKRKTIATILMAIAIVFIWFMPGSSKTHKAVAVKAEEVKVTRYPKVPLATPDKTLPTPAANESKISCTAAVKDYVRNSKMVATKGKVQYVKRVRTPEDKEIALQWKALGIAAELSAEYHIPYQIVLGLMNQESNFNQKAVGPDGKDHGICQIRETNFKWLQKISGKELHPLSSMRDNIECCFVMLSWIKKSYPQAATWNTRLMIYNGGFGYAKRLWSNGKYSSTYSRNILDYAKKIGYKEV